MNQLKDALQRANLVPTDAPKVKTKGAPKPTPKVDPCPDEIGERLAALTASMGEDAYAILDEVATAPYGRARQIARLEAAIDHRLGRMPSGEARKIREMPNFHWGYGRAQDLGAALYQCMDALTDGSYEAWKQARIEASKAPTWPEFIPDDREYAVQIDEYKRLVRAWADQRTELELRMLRFEEYAVIQTAEKVLKDKIQREKEAVEKQNADAGRAVFEKLLAAYNAKEINLDEVGKQLKELSYAQAAGLPDGAYGDRTLAFQRTERAWMDGDGTGEIPAGCEPPDEILLESARYEKAAQERLFQRYPGKAIAIATGDTSAHFIAPDVSVWAYRSSGAYRDYPPVDVGTTLPLEPHPGGWVDPQTKVWISARVEAARQRLLRAKKGHMLICSSALENYGRHPEKRYPRFLLEAWKTKTVVGVAEDLAVQLDDISSLFQIAPKLLPADACWVDAVLIKTAKGGTMLVPARKPVNGALICLQGGTSSHGRHGVSGANVRVTDTNQALHVACYGGSRGGGQHRSELLAQVVEGTDLLLDSGVGYSFRNGTLYRVPGLAEGLPGEPVAVT